MLVGYFRDDQKKYAKAPKLETDASANDYGQAEPKLTNAIRIAGMPLANVHAYHFEAGKHTLLLPKGYTMVLGFTDAQVTPRNAGLAVRRNDGLDVLLVALIPEAGIAVWRKIFKYILRILRHLIHSSKIFIRKSCLTDKLFLFLSYEQKDNSIRKLL